MLCSCVIYNSLGKEVCVREYMHTRMKKYTHQRIILDVVPQVPLAIFAF